MNHSQPIGYSESYMILSKYRKIFLNEDFTKDSASALTALLLYYNSISEKDEITIYINSNGGDEFALIQIYDVMQMIQAPIKTVCMAKAYSAGAFLLAAGSKGRRFIMPHAKVMIHGIQCQFPIENHNDSKGSQIYYKFLTSRDDAALKILAKHTGQPFDKIKEDCKRDVFLTAKEALDYGIVDHIL